MGRYSAAMTRNNGSEGWSMGCFRVLFYALFLFFSFPPSSFSEKSASVSSFCFDTVIRDVYFRQIKDEKGKWTPVADLWRTSGGEKTSTTVRLKVQKKTPETPAYEGDTSNTYLVSLKEIRGRLPVWIGDDIGVFTDKGLRWKTIENFGLYTLPDSDEQLELYIVTKGGEVYGYGDYVIRGKAPFIRFDGLVDCSKSEQVVLRNGAKELTFRTYPALAQAQKDVVSKELDSPEYCRCLQSRDKTIRLVRFYGSRVIVAPRFPARRIMARSDYINGRTYVVIDGKMRWSVEKDIYGVFRRDGHRYFVYTEAGMIERPASPQRIVSEDDVAWVKDLCVEVGK